MAFARPSWAGQTSANPACSINCLATTAPSCRRLPERRATRLRRRRTSAVCRWCSGQRVCAKWARDRGRRHSPQSRLAGEGGVHLARIRRVRAADGSRRKIPRGVRREKRILVRNKIDLSEKLKLPLTPALSHPMGRGCQGRMGRVVGVCCLTGQGSKAQGRHQRTGWSGEIKAEMLQVMINSRHPDALNRARRRCACSTRCGPTPLGWSRSICICCCECRGRNRRQNDTEDLLDSIFSSFASGK